MRNHDPVGIVQGSIISASVKLWVGVGQPSSSKQTSVESSTASQERAFDPSVLKNFQRLIKCHFNCPKTSSRFLQDSSSLVGIRCEHRT